jgi:sulfite reductase beta subunit-like hemoprotein
VLPESPRRTPAPPVPGERLDGYLAWRAQSVVAQRQDGHCGVYVRLRLGDVTSAQLRALGPILEQFGDGSVYLTIDQNLLIPWVHKESLPAIHAALSAVGLAELGLHTVKDVTSCPGAETCNLAVTASRRLGAAISDRLDAVDPAVPGFADTIVKISGCPNSCGQHHIADIGFHGAARKDGGTAYPMYQLHLGGGVDARGARFGRQVVKIPARRVPDAVVSLLELYAADRGPEETAAAFFERVDPKRVTGWLAPLLGAFVPGDEADIGEEKGFSVHTGEGECAA